MRLKGKVAVITGAASGIGRSMVRLFVNEGASVVAVDIDEAGCIGVIANIATAEGQAKILDRERIDILCNNAGILDSLTPLVDTDDQLWDRIMAVNVTAPFQLCRAVVPKMIEAGGGVILNTCSAASFTGGRAGCSYTASKHALLGLTRSIAWYYGDQGIRCNAIAPGAIQTKMQFRDVPHQGGMEKYSKYFPTLPPHGKAMDVAEVACFLVSDESRYVNGAALSVDGGWNSF